MNDEAVVEVVAVLLLYHVQLLESQVHVEDGLNTIDDLTEIIINEFQELHAIFSCPFIRKMTPQNCSKHFRELLFHPRFGRYSMTIMIFSTFPL